MFGRMIAGRGAVITVVAVAAVSVLLWLGQWQWERSRPDLLVAGLPTVDVGEVIPGTGRLLTRDQGRRVSVSGRWRPDRQLLVGDRRRPGGDEPGRWVVTAVEVDTTDGVRLVPVVRGWVPITAAPGTGDSDATDGTGTATDDTATDDTDTATDDTATDDTGGAVLPAAPAGRAEVEGWIQASEALDVAVTVVQPAGVVSLLAAADLVNRWPETVLDGFVIAAPDVAAGALSTGVATPLPGPVESARAGRDWRNVAYAGQWWVFAAFAAVLWWRALIDGAGAPTVPGRAERDDAEGGT